MVLAAQEVASLLVVNLVEVANRLEVEGPQEAIQLEEASPEEAGLLEVAKANPQEEEDHQEAEEGFQNRMVVEGVLKVVEPQERGMVEGEG